MPKKILIISMAFFFFICWINNPGINTPVSTAENVQKEPQLVSDGSGGAIIVWEDFRNGIDEDIFAQRLDANGNALWTTGGIAVANPVGPQRYPQVTADHAGGFIITWYDRRNGKSYDIYAQRLNASGKPQWPLNGVIICAAEGDQFDPMIVPCTGGDVIITWQDRRNGNDYDIYAQKIDSQGKIKWTENGTPVCTEKEDQESPQPVIDGKNGIIITWQDRRNGNNFDIYAQCIDTTGKAQWTPAGIGICTAEHDQKGIQAITDGNEGAIFTWQDKRNGSDYDIYAQKVDGSGRPQWTINGVAICATLNNQYDPRLIADGNGGAIIAWQDYRKGSECNFDAFAEQMELTKTAVCPEKQSHDWNIYTQSIASSGRVKWVANGVSICTANTDQFKPQLATDGSGGAIIIWSAADKERDNNIYGQHLNSSGLVKWTAAGVPVTLAPGEQYDPVIIADGRGGAIVTWYDKRKTDNCDIYAQKI
ncbi:MAG: hypothetical protein MUF15_12635 [Acidobacteria bacterium]|jgi:hypothetical protein|nr:hypothetical protein [Acidobacteriota bacterium]